ncbi:MAG: hypothetical protein JWM86_1936 [Thermoleophilia bacterium]|nr:hypothetical protein [Thermoleophilia bacterium]
MFLALAWNPSSALAVDGSDCRTYPEVAPRMHVQKFAATDVTGGIAGLPDRVTTDLAPGQRGRVCVGFQNRTGDTITLRFQTTDIGANRDGTPTPSGTGDEEYGAGSWLKLPPKKTVELRHGDLVWLDINVDIPVDTAGGSAYAGVAAMAVDSATVGAPTGSQAKVSPAIVVQVFFDVQGDLKRSGRVAKLRSPRVIWWDGLGIDRVGFLGKLRGPGIAPVRFQWVNDGSVTDQVSGSLRIESSLGGKDVTRIPVPQRIILRGSSREMEATWSNEIPFLGRFTPTLEITGSDGKLHTKELPAIWVIPSWYYLLALVIAFAIPISMRRRSRRRYRELVARLEAAEGRGSVDGDYADEDWDHDA